MPAILLTVWGFLKSVSPRTYLEIGLALAVSLFAAWVLRVNDLRAHYKGEVVTLQQQVATDRTLYQKLVDDTKAATAAADAAWAAKFNQKEQQYAANASAADGRYSDLRKQYAAAVVRAQAAAAGHGGPAGTTQGAQGGGAGVPQGSAPVPQLCVSDDDAMKIGQLQAYAQACHEWAMSVSSSND